MGGGQCICTNIEDVPATAQGCFRKQRSAENYPGFTKHKFSYRVAVGAVSIALPNFALHGRVFSSALMRAKLLLCVEFKFSNAILTIFLGNPKCSPTPGLSCTIPNPKAN